LYCVYKGFFNFKIKIKHNQHYWVGLIMLQYFLLSLTSGAFYSDPPLNCLILLTLLLSSNQQKSLNNLREYESINFTKSYF